MGTILKFAAFMGFLALAFYAGYEMGSHRLDDVGQRVEALTRELGTKMGTLDREMRSLKERATLANARDAVERARKAVGDRHFGDAERELNRAGEYLRSLAAEASEKSRATLAPIRETLTEVKGTLRTLGSHAQDRLRKIEQGIDDLARQWDDEE